MLARGADAGGVSARDGPHAGARASAARRSGLPASDRAADLPRPDAVVLAVKTYGFADAVACGRAGTSRTDPWWSRP